MKITNNSVVKLEWSLKIAGKIVEQSLEGEAQTILMGYAKGLPVGLEESLLGHEMGADFRVHLENAYGVHDPSKVHTAKKSDFPTGTKLEPGSSFYTQDETGKPLTARVIELEQDTIIVDFNHERAGKTLEYHVKILSVRVATSGELEHGHVHGEGGVRHEHH